MPGTDHFTNNWSRWADEGGIQLSVQRNDNGSLVFIIRGAGTEPAVATLANFRVAQLLDWLRGDESIKGEQATP